MSRKSVAFLSSFALVTSVVSPAGLAAAPPGDIDDLQDARGSSGEFQMGQRGYALARTEGLTQFWWNGASRTCARIVIGNGRYRTVDTASASDCGHSGGNNAAAAIAGVAAIGLIAALASHKKKGGDRHDDARHDSEYERGYTDGLYGGNYDRNDSEVYHEGFTAGEVEAGNRRAANNRFVRGAPQAAQAACARRGDDYLGVPPGSSVPVGVFSDSRGNYEITVASGHYRARCNVTARGQVTGINPF